MYVSVGDTHTLSNYPRMSPNEQPPVYVSVGDTQTLLDYPRMFPMSNPICLSIRVNHGYPDTIELSEDVPPIIMHNISTHKDCSWGTSMESPIVSGYPWCTRILRHRGLLMGDILGESDSVWVSLVYSDTQPQGVAHGGHSRRVR